MQRDSFVLFDALSRETGNVHRGALVMVTVEQDTAEFQQQVIRDLRAASKERHMDVAVSQTAYEVRTANKVVFNVIIYLMMAMAVLAAVVGSVGLMSTMSINVVERGREIGVMRAIGARTTAVLGIFIVEGMMVGLISWLIALPLSWPGAWALNDLVSTTLLQVPMDFSYSFVGGILWLFIVCVLSAFASFAPALRATRISVRESLAYE
jgi:putative ABC transport system permease protein